MRKNIFILLFFCATSLIANDDNYFADGQENNFEIDQDFIDDFSPMEAGGGSITDSALSDCYEPFAKRGIDRHERSFGLGLSNDTIARVFYVTLTPQVRFQVWKIDSHLALPLRFPVYDNAEKRKQGIRERGFVNAEKMITPRPQDFMGFSDIQRLLRRLELGNKNERYSALLAREYSLSMAHGDLIKEMNTLGLYDQDYLFASGHVDLDMVRLEALMGPLPSVGILGLNARFLPLASLNTYEFFKNTNVDLSYVADYRAPNKAQEQDGAYVLASDQRLVKRNEGSAQGISLGIASEYFAVPWFGAKPYTNYSHLFLTGLLKGDRYHWSYGSSVNLGHDATFYPVANNKKHLVTFRSEGRLFSQNYQPNYFGGHYMLDRANFSERGPLQTKSEYVAFEENNSWRFGHLFELGYALDDIFNIKIGYENARSLNDGKSIRPLRKIHFNTGLLAFESLRIQLGYEVGSILQLGDLFDFEKSRALLSLRGQIKLMPFLYFDTWLKHSFGINEKYQVAAKNGQLESVWLSNHGETRSLNFGLGLELALVF